MDGGSGAGRFAISWDLAAAPSRRSRSLAAAVSRSIVLILVNGVADESSLLVMIGIEIPKVRTVGFTGCFERPKSDFFCCVVRAGKVCGIPYALSIAAGLMGGVDKPRSTIPEPPKGAARIDGKT